jgi:hypothetical protein
MGPPRRFLEAKCCTEICAHSEQVTPFRADPGREMTHGSTDLLLSCRGAKPGDLLFAYSATALNRNATLPLSLRLPGAPYLARFSRDVGYHGSFPEPSLAVIKLEGRRGGIPHLAKNERDMGHPAIVGRDREEGVEFPNPFHAICSSRAKPRDPRSTNSS